MRATRILLVDDNDDFLEGVNAWLAGETEFEVIGVARSGRQALDQIERLRPDLVLTDGTMPEMDGFQATRRIKMLADAPLVVLTTFHDSASARNEAWAAGADGFITKSEITDGLLGLVRSLVGGTTKPGSDRFVRPTDAQPSSRTKPSEAPPAKPRGPEQDLT